MGGVVSASRLGGEAWPQEKAEYLITAFIGERSFSLSSDYWQRLIEFQLDIRWPSDRVSKACRVFAINNYKTRHLAKGLIHLSWCLQDCISASDVTSRTFSKALNGLFLFSIFLKYLIENAKSNTLEELYLSLDETEPTPKSFSKGEGIENLLMYSALSFIAKVDVSPQTYLLHHELLHFMLITMSTQLLSGPSLGVNDAQPFIDAAMIQESSLIDLVVQKLLFNYILRNQVPLRFLFYTILSEGHWDGLLRRVGSAAANLIILPFNFLINSTGEASRSPLAESSLNVLLILSHYRKCIAVEYEKDKSGDNKSEFVIKEEIYFSVNPFSKAIDNIQDIEFNSIVIEGNAQSGSLSRLPFSLLYDTLGTCLADETSVLLLYSLVHGNPDFLEYVLVRTDLDILLMPLLETLYNASRRTCNHIYMVLIILLILSQDSSFNAGIHKLMLPSIPWYQERLLHQTSLGSLMVIVLIRTMKHNLNKQRDVYLHANCLATLANMAPHALRLNAHASQQLVSLFDMLSRKYNKLAEAKNERMHSDDLGENLMEDSSAEIHVYADFLKLVVEIINSILTYALPSNPEVVYAIMHRQEVFLPFKRHPRFNELLENIYTVVDFFSSRMDAQKMNGEWSVDKVLEVIMTNFRSWRGEGMRLYAQLRFTYEQESHPEEFFIPYVWQLILSHSGFEFEPNNINLFPVHLGGINEGLKMKVQSPKDMQGY